MLRSGVVPRGNASSPRPLASSPSGSRGGHLPGGDCLAGGDGGLPRGAGGDHDPQPPQQGRGERGAGLGGGELVVGAAGEVVVAGTVVVAATVVVVVGGMQMTLRHS